MEELGWFILNGDMRQDEEGEWIYTGGRGDSVIDYVIGDIRVKERIDRMIVEEKIDSNHHPISG